MLRTKVYNNPSSSIPTCSMDGFGLARYSSSAVSLWVWLGCAMLGQGSEGVLNRLPRTAKIPRRNFRRLSTRAVVTKSQETTLGSIMFCKHVKQILVGANLDVHLSLNAEVK